MRPVEIRIRAGDRAQVVGEDIRGHVVILGQQLLDEGTRVTIPPSERETRGLDRGLDRDPVPSRATAGRPAPNPGPPDAQPDASGNEERAGEHRAGEHRTVASAPRIGAGAE